MNEINLYGWEIVKVEEEATLPAAEPKKPMFRTAKEQEIYTNRKKASFMYYKGFWQVNYLEAQNWFRQYGHHIMKDNFKKVDNVLYGWDGKHWTKADEYIKKYIFLKFHDKFGATIDSKCMKELLDICNYVDFVPKLDAWDWNMSYQKKLIVTFLNGTLEIDFVNQGHTFYRNVWLKENNAVYVLNIDYEEGLMEKGYWENCFVGRYLLDYYAEYEREQLQQFLAGILVPQFEIQQNLVILGDGGDGKGVLMGALRKLFGNVVTGLRVSEWQGKHDSTALVGSILNVTSERPSREINADTFKSIVANDEMELNPKYKELVYYKPFCKHIMTVNSLPAIEIDPAIIRRLPVIRTCKTTTFQERRVSFKRDFEVDKAGLVSFILQGLFILKKNDFNFIMGTPELQEELIYQNDSLLRDFIGDCLYITENMDDHVVSAYAYEVFSYWEMDNGKNSKPMVRATFSKKVITISKSMGKSNVNSDSRRVLNNGKTARVLTGVQLKGEWVTKYENYKRSLANFNL